MDASDSSSNTESLISKTPRKRPKAYTKIRHSIRLSPVS